MPKYDNAMCNHWQCENKYNGSHGNNSFFAMCIKHPARAHKAVFEGSNHLLQAHLISKLMQSNKSYVLQCILAVVARHAHTHYVVVHDGIMYVVIKANTSSCVDHNFCLSL